MIYYFKGEVNRICKFLGADETKVLEWLESNRNTDLFIRFHLITSLGASILTLDYPSLPPVGNPYREKKTAVQCQVSSLGTHFIDEV